MVYQHPWYVSLAPHFSNDRLGGLFISPTEKVVVGTKSRFSATDRMLEGDRPDAGTAASDRVQSGSRAVNLRPDTSDQQ